MVPLRLLGRLGVRSLQMFLLPRLVPALHPWKAQNGEGVSVGATVVDDFLEARFRDSCTRDSGDYHC